MGSEAYWKRRAAQRMFGHMQSAEETSQLIAEIYYRASRYLSGEAKEVFEKYMGRHSMTEEEARQLLNTLRDPASIQELLEKLQGGVIPAEKAEIFRILESQAYRARIERFEQLQSQIDLVMQQVYRQEKQLQEQHYINLAREAYNRSVFDIQQRAGVGFSFSNIDRKQIERVITTKWSGKNYSARIWKNTQGLAPHPRPGQDRRDPADQRNGMGNVACHIREVRTGRFPVTQARTDREQLFDESDGNAVLSGMRAGQIHLPCDARSADLQ